ncbi:MAG: hypothetical protein HY728_01845 [Candidatus Rokubacteria bacterium]|nr:hypothetical protein [Candidatus Rokubacteria bacterium]
MAPREPEKLYCTCTKQLLRFSDEGVELLCRYCKRVTLARYEELASPAYLDALKRRGKLQTTLALRQLLRMAREYPREPLLAAIQTAAHYGLYDLGRLERMVLRGIATDYFQLPLSLDLPPGDPDDEPTDGRAPAAPQALAPEPDGREPA